MSFSVKLNYSDTDTRSLLDCVPNLCSPCDVFFCCSFITKLCSLCQMMKKELWVFVVNMVLHSLLVTAYSRSHLYDSILTLKMLQRTFSQSTRIFFKRWSKLKLHLMGTYFTHLQIALPINFFVMCIYYNLLSLWHLEKFTI